MSLGDNKRMKESKQKMRAKEKKIDKLNSEKVNKQFSVVKRFKHIITSNVMLRLYKAFILPHLQYCSLIWHFSGTRNSDILESLNKRILQFIFNDSLSSCDELLQKAKIASLYTGRLHKILMVVFKSLFVSTYPGYLKELFVFS